MTMPSPPAPRVLASSAGRAWTGFEAAFLHVPRGKSERPGGHDHVLGMHVGRPVGANCSVGGKRMRGLQKPGDIGFIPAGVGGSWEDDGDCHILRLALHPSLVRRAAQDLGRDPNNLRLVPQVQFRDAGIEAILCAVKADLEAAIPSDPLYVDHLANALAIRLVEIAIGDRTVVEETRPAGLSARQLSILVDYIDANLDKTLHLAELASVAGVSVTRLKVQFRNSTGTPVHQYVIRRRIERARSLIATTTLPASEIAFLAGFAHQSHMTSMMRRILGQTPSEIDRPRNAFRPNLQENRPNLRDVGEAAS